MARRKGRRYKWTILPMVSVPILFLVVPIIFFQVYFSLHQWTAYLGEWWQADFVGLDNFRDVLGESRFYLSFLRSLIFAGSSTVLCLVIGFTLAYLMRDPFPGRSVFYLLFITPMLIVPVAIG